MNVTPEGYITLVLTNRQKGNGFYNFKLGKTQFQVAVVWKEIQDLIQDSAFDIYSAESMKLLNYALEDFCELIYHLTERQWFAKLHKLHDIPFPDLTFGIREFEFVNERYNQYFGDSKFDLLKEAPDLQAEIVLADAPAKRKRRFDSMKQEVIDVVRQKIREHKGTLEPPIMVCYDANDARTNNVRRQLTFREVYLSGISNLNNRLVLSTKAEEILRNG